ncbi:MAG: VanZ family protein [Flavobacteriaceae bacterium]|nr:VanZ family protein [Flavobacteriaceae bacterium]
MGRNYFFYVAVFLAITIAVGSLISLKNGLGIGMQISDKILHASGYCILTISWLLAYRPKTYLWKSLILVAVAVFIYGIIIEILQGVFTYNRQADIYDAFANLAGITMATLFFAIILKKK